MSNDESQIQKKGQQVLADEFRKKIVDKEWDSFSEQYNPFYPIEKFKSLKENWIKNRRITRIEDPAHDWSFSITGLAIREVEGKNSSIMQQPCDLINFGIKVKIGDLSWIAETLFQNYKLVTDKKTIKNDQEVWVQKATRIQRPNPQKENDCISISTEQYVDIAELAERSDLAEIAKKYGQNEKCMFVKAEIKREDYPTLCFVDGSKVKFNEGSKEVWFSRA